MTYAAMLALARQILRYQNTRWVHPLTCGRDSTHRPLTPLCIFDGEQHSVYLVCVDCDYVQTHLPVLPDDLPQDVPHA